MAKDPKVNADKLLRKLYEVLPNEYHGTVFIEVLKMVCAARDCVNEARYSSGYCGLCDLTVNDGKGVRND